MVGTAISSMTAKSAESSPPSAFPRFFLFFLFFFLSTLPLLLLLLLLTERKPGGAQEKGPETEEGEGAGTSTASLRARLSLAGRCFSRRFFRRFRRRGGVVLPRDAFPAALRPAATSPRVSPVWPAGSRAFQGRASCRRRRRLRGEGGREREREREREFCVGRRAVNVKKKVRVPFFFFRRRR